MQSQEGEGKAIALKEEGNRLFKGKDYVGAIAKYSEAMEYGPNISILYSNRARCYRQLQDYEKSYLDAQRGVKLDDKNIKAYFLMGETLSEIAVHSKDRAKIQMAIEQLKKCLRLCPSQGKTEFSDRFVDEIYKAKKKLWLLTTEQSADKKRLLRSYLVNIVETDPSITEEQKDSLNENVSRLLQKKYSAKAEIPRALVCPLTKTIMRDPVCNEYGNSYSRGAYQQLLMSNGRTDPLSGKTIKTNILYPNINIRKAIEHFLERHPWAYEEPVA